MTIDAGEGIPASEAHSLSQLAPAGYYIVLQLGFAFPLVEMNRLPKPWVAHYTQSGYMLDDPLMRWAHETTGVARWSEIETPDPRAILAEAEGFGLKYGAVASCGEDSKRRSYALFLRDDREYTNVELSELFRLLEWMHTNSQSSAKLTPAEIEVLEMIRSGMKLREIADKIRVSEGAIKQRLKNARNKLKARNARHAVALAVQARMI